MILMFMRPKIKELQKVFKHMPHKDLFKNNWLLKYYTEVISINLR